MTFKPGRAVPVPHRTISTGQVTLLFDESGDVMDQKSVMVVMVLLCLAGSLAALYQRRPQTAETSRMNPPAWWTVALCSTAVLIPAAVVTAYLQASSCGDALNGNSMVSGVTCGSRAV